MKIYLRDQTAKLEHHLKNLMSAKVMTYDVAKLVNKVSTVEIETSKKIDELNLDCLFNYRIFPEKIMAYKNQWNCDNRNMQVHDTIAQQAYLPPTKRWSQKIVFGVRINQIINEPHRKGFSYETLEGHVEKGISTFTVEEIEGRLIFKIQTASRPGNFLTRLIGPIFSVPYQTYCTKKALKHVKRQLEKQCKTT